MGGLPNLDDLEAEWAVFMEDRPGKRGGWTQDQRWRADNPGELDLLLAYRAGGPRPALVSATGRRMVEHVSAWLKARDVPAPGPGFDLPAHKLLMPADGIGLWVSYNSPTTQIVGTDGDQFRQRMIVWSTGGGMPSAFYSGRRMYAILGFRNVRGFPGRFFNWHNQPNDKPHGWAPPYCAEWNPTGVSPISFEYWQDNRGLTLVVEPEATTRCGGSGTNNYQVMSTEEMESRRAQWIWLWLELDWGRRDQTPAGSARVWVAGEDSPRVSVAEPIHTHYHDQHQVPFVQGIYHCATCAGHDRDHELDIAAVRFGRTAREAFEDVPVFHRAGTTGQSGGTGSGSWSSIAPRSSLEAAVPAPLRW